MLREPEEGEEFIRTGYRGLTFCRWFENSNKMVRDTDWKKQREDLAQLEIAIPTVIRVKYAYVHPRKLSLNATNVFTRDGWKCWYCGETSLLTLDHIIPKSRGGKTKWTNLITSCSPCNHRKGDRSAEKFCVEKGCEMPQPASMGAFPWLRRLGKNYPESWKKWMSLY